MNYKLCWQIFSWTFKIEYSISDIVKRYPFSGKQKCHRRRNSTKFILKTTSAQTALKLKLEFEFYFIWHISVGELTNDFVISLRQKKKLYEFNSESWRNAVILDLGCWEEVDILCSVGSVYLPYENCPIPWSSFSITEVATSTQASQQRKSCSSRTLSLV